MVGTIQRTNCARRGTDGDSSANSPATSRGFACWRQHVRLWESSGPSAGVRGMSEAQEKRRTPAIDPGHDLAQAFLK